MSDYQKQIQVIKLVKVYADLEKVDILNCGTPMTRWRNERQRL